MVVSSSTTTTTTNNNGPQRIRKIFYGMILISIIFFIRSNHRYTEMIYNGNLYFDGGGNSEEQDRISVTIPTTTTTTTTTTATTTTSTTVVVPSPPPLPSSSVSKVTTTTTTTLSIEEYNKIIQPWDNETIVVWAPKRFYSGFRNQIMSFTSMIIWCNTYNFSQIVLPTLRHKDVFGTNQFILFEDLFDVVHWNSLYPKLPRLVSCDANILIDYDCQTLRFKPNVIWWDYNNKTKPSGIDRQAALFGQYKRYSKGGFNYDNPYLKKQGTGRHFMDLLMIQGGLRPNPKLRTIINTMLQNITTTQSQPQQQQDGIEKSQHSSSSSSIPTYMTLHARVEPDMQAHMVCVEKKVLNLTHIFQFLEDTFPDPPASHIFMPINRQYMEQEGTIKNPPLPYNKTNWMAVHNLQALNHAVQYGLWNGRSKVFEVGTNALRQTASNTVYSQYWSISGAVVNFFIGMEGNVFVGSEVSSYALDILAHRFYRGINENYYYLPDGLHNWTNPNNSNQPAGFSC